MVAQLGSVAPFLATSSARRARPATARPQLSVVGLGYVGAVSVACFASLGFRVVGVDTNAGKVRDIAAGRTPIVERDLGDLLADGVAQGRITATTDLGAAIASTDVTLLSVGTPTAKDGGADLSQLRAACRAIGTAIAGKGDFHVVILRCSVPPGTTLTVVLPELEAASGMRAGDGFGLAFVPEFLREGVAVADFHAPPKTVISGTDPRTIAATRAIFGGIGDVIHECAIGVAETVKYVDNVWHATKVVFANEVGRLCQSLDVDSHTVMDLFVKDTKLNVSPYYLKPGFAFGGSCLPKEVRAVSRIGAERQLSLPLIDSLIPSNRAQIDAALQWLAPFKGRHIGLLGLTFKPDTDDVRESPLVELMADLMERGFVVSAFDANIRPGPALDAQLSTLRQLQPSRLGVLAQLDGRLRQTLHQVMTEADVVVVGHATNMFRDAVANRRAGQHVFDLARLYKKLPADTTYHGIAW
jgi:GDP-mannose 6-dehydrogenase